MKKLFFGLIATLFTINFIYSQSLEELKYDKGFYQLLKTQYEILKKTNDKSSIKKILSDEKIEKSEELVLANAFGFSSFDEYTKVITNQILLTKSIYEKYKLNDYSDNELTPIYEFVIIELELNGNTTQGTNCLRRLNNCTAIAAAAAVGGYYACSAVTIGWPICAGAVFIAHIAMQDNCKLDYEECKKK